MKAYKGLQEPIAIDSDVHTILDTLPQIVYQTDNSGAWIYLSNAWTRITGLPIKECLGRPQIDSLHPEDADRYQKMLSILLQNTDTDHADTLRFLTRDNGYVWLECHARSHFSDRSGDIEIVGTLSNITDRVDEEALLLAHHRTLSGMLNDLPGMAYRCRNNPDWTMEYVSAGSLELTGYLPEDVINSKTLSYGSLIHPDDSQFVWSEVQSALRENRRFEMNYRIVTADGAIKWVWENGKGIYSPGQELLGLEGIIINIKKQHEKNDLSNTESTLYDPLTNTPGLALFKDRINQTKLERRPTGKACSILLCLNLNHFQRVVEKYSPELLSNAHIDIVERLVSTLEPADSICCLSNTRFAVLMKRDPAGLDEFCRQLQDLFLQPLHIAGNTIFVTLSIGAVINLQNATAADDPLGKALVLMNNASELGDGHYEVTGYRD